MARLDRLATTKEIAQLGATIGREFSYELLQAVSPLDERVLQNGLQQLVGTELVYQRGTLPQASYMFKHALIQDTAYQSLLKSRRQQLHQQIAQVLEDRFADIRDTQPELLAHHYTEASLIAQAIPYWQQAGQQAVQRSANTEAIHHLTTALELLKTLPDTPERSQQELTLQITLGVPLIASKGWASPEAKRAYARAQELCRQIGETPQLYSVLFGLWLVYLLRGELQTARALAEQLLRLAHNGQDSSLLLAYFALGNVLFWLGELIPAREHLEQGIALYDPQSHRSLAFLYGVDPGVYCLSYTAWDLLLLGYPDQALKRGQEAIALAQDLSHPHSFVFALNSTASVHLFRREERAGQERAEAVIALATEQGLPDWVAWGTTQLGWALAEQGQVEEGIAQLQQGLAASRATGAELLRPWLLAPLAEAYRKKGQPEKGLRVVAEALYAVHENQVRHYEAELLRIKGALTLESKVGEAEICFLKAIEIAQKQQAKSLELRATMSLARLWQAQGKLSEARNTLSTIYNWFTEGFDTKDLQEAQALLNELGC